MKVRVDKEEYESLLQRVSKLEKALFDTRSELFENWHWTKQSLYDMMEDYFKTKCITTITKRNEEMVMGEMKKKIDDLFEEDKKC